MQELAWVGVWLQKVKLQELGEGIRKLLKDKIVLKLSFPLRSPYSFQNCFWSCLLMTVALHVVLRGLHVLCAVIKEFIKDGSILSWWRSAVSPRQFSKGETAKEIYFI